jgi:hypothetical protein
VAVDDGDGGRFHGTQGSAGMSYSTDDMALEWSGEASVEDETGVYHAFQMDTLAVRAKWPDGFFVVRLLERGALSAGTYGDAQALEQLKQSLVEQANAGQRVLVVKASA